MQHHRLDAYHAARFDEVMKRLRMDWIAVGGVDVEVARSHQQVLWIGRLEDGDSSGREHPERLVEELEQKRKRQVLHDMDGREAAESAVAHLSQGLEEVAVRYVEIARAALIDGHAVRVDSGGRKAFVAQELEQLSATASHVEDGPALG